MAWIKLRNDTWYSNASKNKLLIKHIKGYHEIIGGDFYEYIPIERYSVLSWNKANRQELADCETLEEAQKVLEEFLEKDKTTSNG